MSLVQRGAAIANFSSGELFAPHCAHRFASAAPQNRLPAGFSAPQFTQRIESPLKPNG
jgi:hypothetical protein